MNVTIPWFIAISALTGLGYALGHWIGRGPQARAWVGLGLGIVMIAGWAWLAHHPAVAVNTIRPDVLAYLEGTGAVPLFMIVVGIAWSRSRLPRQKRVAALAVLIGALHFLQGGMWMLQTTPSEVLGRTVSSRDGMVMQTQSFSCVPAACATALNQLGIAATEAEMAELTHTRAGTGATIVRALVGLQNKLRGSHWRAELVQADYDHLVGLNEPVLTPLRLEATRRHMVVLQAVTAHHVKVLDPQFGPTIFTRNEFEQAYEKHIVRFERVRPNPSPMLARF